MMEVTVDKLSMENAQLLRENEALTAMIAQLQAKHGIEDRANKRVKHEDGIDNSIDSSESAAGETLSGCVDHLPVLDLCDDPDAIASSSPPSSSGSECDSSIEDDVFQLPSFDDSDYSPSTEKSEWRGESSEALGDIDISDLSEFIPDTVVW